MKWAKYGKYLGAIVVAGALSPAHAAKPVAVECGGVYGPGGKYVMTENFLCSEEPALTIVGPAKLDMKGNTLTCDGVYIGVDVIGRRATVSNGSIAGCADNAVHVAGDGGHKILRLTLTSEGDIGDDGIDVDSNNNTIVNNLVMGWPDKGILLDEGTRGNKVINNTTTNNDIGIKTDGGGDVLSASTDNKIHGNVALDNDLDLANGDNSDGDCNNKWSGNDFSSSVGPPGCVN